MGFITKCTIGLFNSTNYDDVDFDYYYCVTQVHNFYTSSCSDDIVQSNSDAGYAGKIFESKY